MQNQCLAFLHPLVSCLYLLFSHLLSRLYSLPLFPFHFTPPDGVGGRGENIIQLYWDAPGGLTAQGQLRHLFPHPPASPRVA